MKYIAIIFLCRIASPGVRQGRLSQLLPVGQPGHDSTGNDVHSDIEAGKRFFRVGSESGSYQPRSQKGFRVGKQKV